MLSIVARSAALNAFNLTPEQEREVAKRERAMWDIHCAKSKEDGESAQALSLAPIGSNSCLFRPKLHKSAQSAAIRRDSAARSDRE